MGKDTSISWTDHTFNPWWGCMKVSPGCKNCYAEAFAKRVGQNVWGPSAEYRTFGFKHWQEPKKWNDDAAKRGVTERVFCASMADVFDERGDGIERTRLWSVIWDTPNLIWQLLTKRPENWQRYLPSGDRVPPNVWLGFTAEDQEHYDLRAKHMADLRSNYFSGPFFVSYEPAIGPLRIPAADSRLRWLIFGGESGHGRRPMQREWADDIKADCEALGIAFFMKQMSARTPAIGKSLIPAELLIQQFPELGERE
jgi:protein gp37